MTTLLEAHQVSKIFGGGLFDKRVTVALDDFSLSIESDPPPVTAIVGESGSGKTTLARLLLGLVSPTTGRCCYHGTDLQKLPKQERRAFLRDVQVIFQDPYEVYNPFYQVDHVLETPIAKFKLANSAQARPRAHGGVAARGRPATRRDARPLPAPAQRRPAPAHHGGPRAAAFGRG